jgi:hypothetical protein
MIPSSNSPVKRSGTLNHYVGDLLHTMAISKLSRMRTEAFQLCVTPSSAPHPVKTNCQSPRHGNFGDLSTSPLGQVEKPVAPSVITAYRDLRSFYQQET